MPFLTDFRVLRPAYEQTQAAILAWIAKAHAKAAKEEVDSPFHEALKARLNKI